jgi:hypothetical protein
VLTTNWWHPTYTPGPRRWLPGSTCNRRWWSDYLPIAFRWAYRTRFIWTWAQWARARCQWCHLGRALSLLLWLRLKHADVFLNYAAMEFLFDISFKDNELTISQKYLNRADITWIVTEVQENGIPRTVVHADNTDIWEPNQSTSQKKFWRAVTVCRDAGLNLNLDICVVMKTSQKTGSVEEKKI